MTHCPSCGTAALPGYRFCAECGAPLAPAPSPSTPPGAPATSPPAAGRAEVAVAHLLPSGDRHHPVADTLVIGRTHGEIQAPGDSFLSSRHVSVVREGGRYLLRDLGSQNGTYVRVRESAELRAGDQVMMGGQIFRLDATGRRAGGAAGAAGGRAGGATRVLGADSGAFAGPQLVRVLEGGEEAERIALPRGGLVVGRTKGDLVFPDDPLLSGTHASFAVSGGDPDPAAKVTVRDLGSRNGVLLRIREDWPLRFGDTFAAGRQVFRFEPGPAGA